MYSRYYFFLSVFTFILATNLFFSIKCATSSEQASQNITQGITPSIVFFVPPQARRFQPLKKVYPQKPISFTRN